MLVIFGKYNYRIQIKTISSSILANVPLQEDPKIKIKMSMLELVQKDWENADIIPFLPFPIITHSSMVL